MIGSDSIGLLFRAKGDTSDAKKAFNDLSDSVEKDSNKIKKDVETGTTGAGAGFSSLTNLAGIAAAGIAAVSTAAIATTVSLFNLTRSVAQSGAEIANFQKLTGLAAESISTIKVASENAGTSLDEFEEVWESFIETLIEGGKGADDAKEKLKQAGIDPQKGFKDLDESVQKAFDAIRKAETQAQKSAIAMAVFGESGLNMVKVAEEMTGGFDEYTRKLREMGLATDEQGIKKAKEYDRQLKQTEMQIAGVSRIIAMEFMPVFLDMAKSTSAWLKENRNEIKGWATTSGDFLRGLAATWQDLITKAKEYAPYAELALNGGAGAALAQQGGFDGTTALKYGLFGSGMLLYDAAGKIANRGAQERLNQPKEIDYSRPQDKKNDYTPQDLEKQKQAAEKAAADQIAANARLNQAIADGNRALYEKLQTGLIESYKERGITAEQFNGEFLENERNFRVKMLDLIEKEFDQKRAQEKNATARKALDIEEQTAKEKLIEESTSREKETEKLITETQKEETEKRVKQTEEMTARKISLHKIWTEAAISDNAAMFQKMLMSEEGFIRSSQNLKLRSLEFEKLQLSQLEQTAEVKQQIQEIDAQITIQRNENEKEWFEYYDRVLDNEIDKTAKKLELEQLLNTERERAKTLIGDTDPLSRPPDIAPEGEDENGFLSTIREFLDIDQERIFEIGDAFVAMGDMVTGAFSQMANAVGNVVENWVLMGETGPAMFRKIVAAALASIAAESAVRAIFELAKGFAALFFNPAEASAHFTAAALFGSISVGTALIGRAIAGDAFKGNKANQTQNSSALGQAQRQSSDGGAYSSNRDKLILDMARNTSSERPPQVIEVHDKTGMGFEEFLSYKIRSNGPFRYAIKGLISDD